MNFLTFWPIQCGDKQKRMTDHQSTGPDSVFNLRTSAEKGYTHLGCPVILCFSIHTHARTEQGNEVSKPSRAPGGKSAGKKSGRGTKAAHSRGPPPHIPYLTANEYSSVPQ